MRILLTGSNGYIAQSILKLLDSKHEFVPMSREICDLTDTNSVNSFFIDNGFFDCVIHTAIVGGSRLIKDDTNTIHKNISMFYNLYINKGYFARLISFGSGAEIYNFSSPYGFSKGIINNIIEETENFYNLRIFGIFDENELKTRFIKSSIINILNDNPIEIYNNKKMDFFYVKDLIKVMEYYLTNQNPPKQIDCCYKEHYSLLDIASYITSLHSGEIVINQRETSLDYIGNFKELYLEYIGLFQGIKNTFNILKDKYEN
jgi:nucleoside-diphosphate-sugar epimerase